MAERAEINELNLPSGPACARHRGLDPNAAPGRCGRHPSSAHSGSGPCVLGPCPTLNALRSTLYALRSTLFALRSTLFALRSTLLALRPSLFALHSTLCAHPPAPSPLARIVFPVIARRSRTPHCSLTCVPLVPDSR